MLGFLPADRLVEAAGDGTARRAQRANRAAIETITDRNRAEREATEKLLARLKTLRAGLQQRLLAAPGSVTDFRRMNLTALLADTDRLITEATADLAELGKASYNRMAELGDRHAVEPLRAAQLTIVQATPGISGGLVTAAFDNTVDLLSVPMRQFSTDVKLAVRRLALAGDSRMEEIQRLRDKISGAGFDNAQFKAERIIRTQMGMVFGTATFDRLSALSEQFPFLGKGWRASRDSRTRLGHREAGERYARGKGIPIAERFVLNVYDERGKGAAKLLGTATLRFPVDPEAQPAGRLAAASVIMCRCNAFVDMNLAEFSKWSAAKVQVAVPAKTAPPAPVRLPAAPRPVKNPKVKLPRVKTPAKPKPQRGPVGQYVPAGPKVSAAVEIKNVSYFQRPLKEDAAAKVERALAVIDSLHGDGNLPTIPAVTARKGHLAYYSQTRGTNQPVNLGFSREILAKSSIPNVAVWHETGHFLDHVGVNQDRKSYSSESDPLFAMWRKAVDESKAMQTLVNWRAGLGRPAGATDRYLSYLIGKDEAWARSYAQWVAIRSGDKDGLRELRKMQSAATLGNVPAGMRYNVNKLGKKPEPGTWDYPMQWDDEDFKPIAEAIDSIMERLGWRKLSGK